MQNSFGLKDLFLFVLVLLVGVLVFLQMKQSDNLRRDVFEPMQGQIEDLGDGLGQLRRELNTLKRSGISVSGGGGEPTPVDESWAVEGVPIKRPPLYMFHSDPESLPGFEEGGVLTELGTSPPSKLTPYLAGDVFGARNVGGRVFEPLGELNRDTLDVSSRLAEAWQVDPEGLWVRAKIRDEATWSDGRPVTAEDVAWTYHDIIMNERVEANRSRSTLKNMIDVEALDEKVVHFTFEEPLFNIEAQAYGFTPLPKHYYSEFSPEQFNASTALLLGSGPYRVPNSDPSAQWKPGDTDFLLVRNENYWGSLPPIREVRFTFRGDATAVLIAFENQEGDLMAPRPKQYSEKLLDERFRGFADLHQWRNIQSAYSFIAWNTGEKPDGSTTPFGDKRVRQAMTMLVDRKTIVRDISQGLGDVSFGPNPPGPASSPNVEPWPYDPERAVALLAEAGWVDRNGDGILEDEDGTEFVFEYTIPNTESSQKLANFVSDSFLRHGIRVEIVVQEWSRFREILKNRNYDAITLAWSAGGPESDPIQLWHPNSIADGGDNFTQWRNERAGELIDQGRATLDDDERMQVWHDLHELIHEEQPYTFLVRRQSLLFVNKRVENFYPLQLTYNHFDWMLPEP